MARTKLALRNAPSAEAIAYNLGRKLGTKLYGMGKTYFQRRKQRRLDQRGRPTSTQVPTNMGRSMMRVQTNLPKKLKTGLKHCNSLTKQKLMLFKDALKKQANRIFYYRGVYKATQESRIDNVDWLAGSAALQDNYANDICGGAIGHSRVVESYANLASENASYGMRYGNCLAICLDLPTGTFLPNIFKGDKYDGTNIRDRQFGMTQDQAFGTYTSIALNSGERGQDGLAAPNFLLPEDTQKLYNLSYKYTFSFRNFNSIAMNIYVVTFKLGTVNVQDSDQWKGLSNWINTYIAQDPNGSHKRLARGQLPKCFRTIKVKKIKLGGTSSGWYGSDIHMNQQRTGKIVLKSPKEYLCAHTRPADISSNQSINISEAWFEENWHKFTYCFVYAVPCDLLGETNANTTPISGTVKCIIEKETSYTRIIR